MIPTVTSLLEGRPGAAVVQSLNLPVRRQPGLLEGGLDLRLLGAVEGRRVEAAADACLAARPRWVSRICPTFMRLGTPSGLSTMSTGRAVLEVRHVLERP